MKSSRDKTLRPPLLDWISAKAAFLSGAGVLVLTLIISYDVLMRYFLNDPQLFVDEIASFLLLAIIFLGMAHTFQRGGHIRIDLVTNHLHPGVQNVLRKITLLLGLGLLGIASWETFISALVAYRMERVSAVMFYPLWIPMLFTPLGLALLALTMVKALVKGEKTEASKSVTEESVR